jgi:hypothetical protein
VFSKDLLNSFEKEAFETAGISMSIKIATHLFIHTSFLSYEGSKYLEVFLILF